MKYFEQFPLIEYNNKYAKNLLLNTKIIDEIFSKYKVFYDYTVREGQRVDYIASRYYGDPYNSYIVYLSNSVIDPSLFLPLDHQDFLKYVGKKYNKRADLTKSDISHYKYTGIGETQSEIDRKSWKMTPYTYSQLSSEDKSGWTPVYVYDYELELNEDKRNIKLISNKYLDQINQELGSIFK